MGPKILGILVYRAQLAGLCEVELFCFSASEVISYNRRGLSYIRDSHPSFYPSIQATAQSN